MSILCVFCFTFVGFIFLPKDDAPTGETPEISTRYSGGSGYSYDPYLISSEDDFAVLYEDMQYGVTGGNYYLQTCNIDLSSYSLYSNGVSGIFEGFYNGGGFEVYIGFQSGSVDYYVGLFPATSGATVCNLIVKGTWFFSNANSGFCGVGGVVGFAQNSLISRCAFEGAVYAGGDYACVGGIAGFTDDSTFSECVFRGQIHGDSGFDNFGGGIVGASYSISSEGVYDSHTYIDSCLAVGEFYGLWMTGGIMGVSTAEEILCCVSEMYNSMGNIIGMNCYLDYAIGEYEDRRVPYTCDIYYCVSVYDGPILFFGIDVNISECWYNWGAYTDMPYDPDFYDAWGYTSADNYCYWSSLYNEQDGYEYEDYVENYTLYYACGAYGYPTYREWYYDGYAIDDQYVRPTGGFDGWYSDTYCIPDIDYTFYVNQVRSDWYYANLAESISIACSGYAIPMLTWYEALYVFLWDSDGNFVKGGHLADYTDNFEDTSDYEIGGDYIASPKPLEIRMWVYVAEIGSASYNMTTADLSGLSAIFSFTNTNNVATTETMKGYGLVQDILIDTNVTVTISVDNTLICTGIFMEDETKTPSSTEVVSRSFSASTWDYDYDYNYEKEVYIYLKKVSNNVLNSYYFSDGTFPQTAVVTYNTAFNTLLTNRCDESTYFDSNGTRFYIMTYTHSSSDLEAYVAYSGQKFLGFEYTGAAKTIKLKDREGVLTDYTFTPEVGMYWFKFEPIRWRITNYDTDEGDLPEDFDEFGEGQIDFSVVTDVLWIDAVHDGTTTLGVGSKSSDTSLMKSMLDGTFMGGLSFGFSYSKANSTINDDYFVSSSTSNKKVLTGTKTWSTSSVRVASVAEISKYQSELGCYGSQLACVLAGKGQDQFLEYWTRDFGQSVGCGTYVTSSGVVMKNSYYASKAKGIRFAITMSEGSNLG